MVRVAQPVFFETGSDSQMFGRRRGDRAAKLPREGSSATATPTAQEHVADVPLTWLQQPTLAETNGMTPLSGTSFYQEAIAPIVEHLRTGRPQVELFTVQLAVLSDGPYVGTVAVYADGRRVGSIPTGMTAEYAPVVRVLTDSGAPATCRAGSCRCRRRGAHNRNLGLASLTRRRPRRRTISAALDRAPVGRLGGHGRNPR
jgi:hypothetical protein